MPWVRFVKDFDFVPARKRTISIAFKRGMVVLVTTECFGAAYIAGAAERTEKPRPREQIHGR